MGLCASNDGGDPEAARRSKQLDKEMRKDHVAEERVLKLLLLGAGESGKSTLFKQMLVLYVAAAGMAPRARARRTYPR